MTGDGDTSAPSFDDIAETFELLDDWEEKYRYVIELGKDLPGLPESERTAARKVDGCASQVWLAAEIYDGVDGTRWLRFEGDSDAHIVRGLIAILRSLLSGRPTPEIVAADVQGALSRLGLDSALSSQRSNGLRAMVTRLKAIAAAA